MPTEGGQKPAKAHMGIGLTDLAVVIASAAILVALGVPAYRYVVCLNRVLDETNSLLADLQFARSEAIKEGRMVTVCPSVSQARCDPDPTSWQHGWIVFSDVNNNRTVGAPADIVLTRRGFVSEPRQDTLTADNGLRFVSFDREGFATSFPAGVAANGYVTITLRTTPSNSRWTRCVQVFTTGLMRLQKTSDPQGNCT